MLVHVYKKSCWTKTFQKAGECLNIVENLEVQFAMTFKQKLKDAWKFRFLCVC